MRIIRRLIALGTSVPDLISVLRCQVLSVLQYAVPAWITMISKAESRSIESVQKTGLYLIFGAKFRSYTWALEQAGMKTQGQQRSKIFEKFTRPCTTSQKFSKWFCKSDRSNLMTTRSNKVKFKPVLTRTNHYAKSPIPQMVDLANELGITQTKTLKLKSGSIIML